MKDGSTHHALTPHSVPDPSKSESEDGSVPELVTDLPVKEVNVIPTPSPEKKQHSSLEKMKAYVFGTPLSSSKSKTVTSKQGSSSTEPRKLDTVFDDEANSTALTVQTSGSKTPPVAKKKKKKQAPLGSPRVTRSKAKVKGGKSRI